MSRKIGILALQGDYAKHGEILAMLGIEPVYVKYEYQLNEIEGLVLPGGESTTLTKLIHSQNLHESLVEFGKSFPVLGTCAGLIMLAKKVDDSRVKPFGLLDIEVERNGYGRQVESFTSDLLVTLGEKITSVRTTFIRAPRIKSYGKTIKVIASQDNEPVVVRSGNIMGMSFHPELDKVDLFHRSLFMKNTKEIEFMQEQLNAS